MKLLVFFFSCLAIFSLGCLNNLDLSNSEELTKVALLLQSGDLTSQLTKAVPSQFKSASTPPPTSSGPMLRVTPLEYNWYIKNIYFLNCQSKDTPVACTPGFTTGSDYDDKTPATLIESTEVFSGDKNEYKRHTVQQNDTPIKIILNDTGESVKTIEVSAAEIPYIGGIQIEMIVEEIKTEVEIGGVASTIYIDQAMTNEADTLASLPNFASLTDTIMRGDQLFDLDPFDGAFGFFDSGQESATRPSSYGYSDESIDEPIDEMSRGIDIDVEWFNQTNMSYLIPAYDTSSTSSTSPDDLGPLPLNAGSTYNASLVVDYKETFSWMDSDNDKTFDADEPDEYESVFFALPKTQLKITEKE